MKKYAFSEILLFDVAVFALKNTICFLFLQNSNLLQATLHLIKELDAESLEVISDAIRNRLESLWHIFSGICLILGKSFLYTSPFSRQTVKAMFNTNYIRIIGLQLYIYIYNEACVFANAECYQAVCVIS